MTVDPSPHIPLIHRVIRQMGIRGSDAEEAFSVGLVAITEAARSFNPDKGVLASWLANNIKWQIKNWRNQENKYRGNVIWAKSSGVDAKRGPTGFHTSYDYAATDNTEIGTSVNDIEDQHNNIELSQEMKETLALVQSVCNETEQKVIISLALGYSGREICQKFGMTPVQVTRAKQRARQKLEAARG